MKNIGHVAAATIMLASSAAPAQQSTVPATQTEDRGHIEVVIVTAQKRLEDLQDVPIAITAVSDEELKSSGVQDIQTLNTVVPGFKVSFRQGVMLPSIRGVSTNDTATENPAAMYVDGVYLQSQREGFQNFNDVAQVAVLKGPQGTLFGRNATAGVVQISTKQPTQDLTTQANLSYDSYQTANADAYISGGLTDQVAASLSLAYGGQGEGYGTALALDREIFKLDHTFGARAKLLVQLGDRTDATIIADYQDRQDSLGPNYRPFPGTVALLPAGGCVLTSDVRDSCTGLTSRNSFEGGGASLTLNHDFDFARLVSISAYRKGEGEGNFSGDGRPGAHAVVDAKRVEAESFQQEVQLISDRNDNFEWTAGLFYFHARNANDPLDRFFRLSPAPTANAMTRTVADETIDSYAAFAQADLKITPSTTLTLGGRWTYEERDYAGRLSATRNDGTFIPVVDEVAGNETFREPTWRIALKQDLSQDISVYASYSRGFKSGGFNIVSITSQGFEPEFLDAYEAGLKSELLDRRLRLNLAGFYYQYDNLQVTQYVNLVQSVSNAAKAELYGFEFDAEAVLTDSVKIRAGGTLQQSEFEDFRDAVFSTPRVDMNGNPTGGNILSPGDATGNQIPHAQDFTGTAAIDYSRDFDFGNLHANITVNYGSKFYYEADNHLFQPHYTLLNTLLGWTAPDGHLGFDVWGRNLLDEELSTHAFSAVFGSQISYGQPPRTYGATVRLKW